MILWTIGKGVQEDHWTMGIASSFFGGILVLPTDFVGMMGIDTDICLGIDTDIVDIVGGWKDLPWNPNEKTVYIYIYQYQSP